MCIARFSIMAERTKHIHAQRSFCFLAERLVGESTGQPFNSLIWENPSFYRIFSPFSMEIFRDYPSRSCLFFSLRYILLRVAIIIRVKNTNKKGGHLSHSIAKETKETISASDDHFA